MLPITHDHPAHIHVPIFLYHVPYINLHPNSVRMIEGTVHTLLEDKDHHITGVSYKDKDSGEMKVNKNKLSCLLRVER